MSENVIQEFEDSLSNNIQNPDIKYSLDRVIEGEVKYGYLTEKFGKERVDALVSDFLFLSDFDFFLKIKEKLENNGND
jgi:hypothetical protein